MIRRNKNKDKSELTEGVLYYSVGTRMLVRMAVSMATLRRVYQGPATVLIGNEEGHGAALAIAKRYSVKPITIDYNRDGRNNALLTKTRMAEYTPFDVSVFLDLDTVVLREFDQLFRYARDFSYVACEFCGWTTATKRIRGRIDEVARVLPDYRKGALRYQYAINGGVMAFRKDDSFMADWWKLTAQCRDVFIPDEKVTQLVLYKYRHFIADQTYNTSCKLGDVSAARIIHFHGDKHCRLDPSEKRYLFNSDIWYREFELIKDLPEVKPYIKHDRMLRKYLKQKWWD